MAGRTEQPWKVQFPKQLKKFRDRAIGLKFKARQLNAMLGSGDA